MSNLNSVLFEFYHGQRNSHQQRSGHAHFRQKGTHKSISYTGTFLNDNFHGICTYTQTTNNCSDKNWMYEGRIYVNTFQGYGTLTQGHCENGQVYQGLFKDNKRFGPGVATNWDGTEDVGFWNAAYLLRLSEEVNQGQITKLARSKKGYDLILNNRKIIECPKLDHEGVRCDIENICVRNINSVFFNKAIHEGYQIAPEQLNINDGNRNDVEEALLKLKCHILNQQLFQTNDVVYIQYSENDELNCCTKYKAMNNNPYMVSVMERIIQFCDDESCVHYTTSRILQNKRDLFNSPGIYESSNKLFLELCAAGNDTDIENLYHAQGINPDVTDNTGNSGMMFAAANDKVYVIKRLVNLGGNLNMINDEGINPLNLCLLRYLSQKNGISDWEAAFLFGPYPEMFSDSPSNTDVIPELLKSESIGGEDCERSAKIMQYFGKIDCDANDTLFEDTTATDSNKRNDNLKQGQILQSLKDTFPTSLDEPFTRFKMYIKDREYQNFQNSELPANLKSDPLQQYLFDWAFKTSANTKTTKNQKKTQSVVVKKTVSGDDFLETKLIVVTDTIEVLLRLGADPNLCSFPMPALILSLYCNSPEILKMLLLANADINHSYTRDNLTLLHILCSMPPAENLHKMAKLLLQTKINPLQRCAFHHWETELPQIQGIVEENLIKIQQSQIFNTGKTPLHLLAFRMDYEEDLDGYLGKLGKTIGKECPETFCELYVGHTPLSLAVLRGNMNLVYSLLEAGADPNFQLEEGLGNCLTLFGLKRFSKGLGFPIEKCKKILDALVLHGGNPLGKVGENENALEFISKDNFRIRSYIRKSMDKSSIKASNKSGKGTEKSRTRRKSLKKLQSTTDDLYSQIYEYLLTLSQDIILTHHHGKIAIFLLQRILQGSDLTRYRKLLEFFNEDDAVKIIAIFAHTKHLDLSKDPHYFLALLFLEYVKKFGKPPETKTENEASKNPKDIIFTKEKSKTKNKKKNISAKLVKSKVITEKIDVIKHLSDTETLQSKKNEVFSLVFPKTESAKIDNVQYLNQKILNTIQRHEIDVDAIVVTYFELDPDNKKYRVCFNCGLREGKKLECCPDCGLIFFCSSTCNIESNKKKTGHPCNIIFYEENQNILDENLGKDLKSTKSLVSVNSTSTLSRRIEDSFLSVMSVKQMTLRRIFKNLEIKIPSASLIQKTQMLNNLKSCIDQSGIGSYRRMTDIRVSSQDTSEVRHSLTCIFPSCYSMANKQLTHTPISIPTNHPSVESIDNYVPIDVHADLPKENPNLNSIYVSTSDFKNLHTRMSQTKKESKEIPDTDSRFMESVKRISYVEVRKLMSLTRDVPAKQETRNSSNFRNESIVKTKMKRSLSKVCNTKKSITNARNKYLQEMKRNTTRKTTEVEKSFQAKMNIDKKFVSTLEKIFPEFDFTTAMAPFVAYSDTQFYYKFGDQRPKYFSTHM